MALHPVGMGMALCRVTMRIHSRSIFNLGNVFQLTNQGKKARMTRWEPSLMWYQRLKQYDTVPQLWKDTSSCVNVCSKICLATFRPMSTNLVICTINKSTPEEIPKRICIGIDFPLSYKHHREQIGDTLCCVKVCHLVCPT